MRGKKKYIMSQSELASLQSDSNEVKGTLRAIKSGDYGAGRTNERVDRVALERQAKKFDRMIADNSPGRVTKTTKDRLHKRQLELEKSIREGMPSYDEMWDIKRNPGVPRKSLKWEARNSGNIEEYKQIMRQLEPDDPTASSVERLRRRK